MIRFYVWCWVGETLVVVGAMRISHGHTILTTAKADQLTVAVLLALPSKPTPSPSPPPPPVAEDDERRTSLTTAFHLLSAIAAWWKRRKDAEAGRQEREMHNGHKNYSLFWRLCTERNEGDKERTTGTKRAERRPRPKIWPDMRKSEGLSEETRR